MFIAAVLIAPPNMDDSALALAKLKPIAELGDAADVCVDIRMFANDDDDAAVVTLGGAIDLVNGFDG